MLSTFDADILVPISLHEVGGLASQTVHYVPSISYPRLSAFKPALLSQASPDLLERYSQLVRHKGILGLGPRLLSADRTPSRTWRQQRRTYIYPTVRRVRDPLANDGEHDIAGWGACRCRSSPFLHPVEIAWCVRFSADFFCDLTLSFFVCLCFR